MSVDTIGRYIDQHSADTSTECWPLLGRHIDQDSAGCWSSISRASADISTDVCVDRYGFSLFCWHSADTSSILYRQSADTSPILGWYAADQASVESRSICQSLIARHYTDAVSISLLLSVDIKNVLSSFIVGGTCGLLEQIIIIIVIIIITLLPIIRRSDYSRQRRREEFSSKKQV